jgi:hypothetical protein
MLLFKIGKKIYGAYKDRSSSNDGHDAYGAYPNPQTYPPNPASHHYKEAQPYKSPKTDITSIPTSPPRYQDSIRQSYPQARSQSQPPKQVSQSQPQLEGQPATSHLQTPQFQSQMQRPHSQSQMERSQFQSLTRRPHSQSRMQAPQFQSQTHQLYRPQEHPQGYPGTHDPDYTPWEYQQDPCGAYGGQIPYQNRYQDEYDDDSDDSSDDGYGESAHGGRGRRGRHGSRGRGRGRGGPLSMLLR